MSEFSAIDKARCAEREHAMRLAVYKGRVAAGRMKQEIAGREIALMREIALDYRMLAEKEGATSEAEE